MRRPRPTRWPSSRSSRTTGEILLEGDPGHGKVSLDVWNPDTGQQENGNVGGVIVRFWGSGLKASPASLAGGAAPDFLDPRNALALVRLCQWLHEDRGVTELYHAGISGDSSIGDATFIMTPDHPTSAPGTPHGREARTGHVHMQIGVTGTA